MVLVELPRLVAVMGDTGAGKSSFIKLITGDNRVKVGGGLRSGEPWCFEKLPLNVRF